MKKIEYEDKRDETKAFKHVDVKYEVKEATTVTYSPKTIKSNIPLLPLDLWWQITSFLTQISNDKNTEAIVSLTVLDGEWVPLVWHQQTQGNLHVKFDVTSEENQALLSPELNAALQELHCTIHSHNKSKAFQSGDDADDELGKEGWHITVGECNKPVYSLHTRFNCKINATFNDQGEKLEEAFQSFIVTGTSLAVATPKLPRSFKRKWVLGAEDIIAQKEIVAFPDEWMDRVRTYTYSTPQSQRGSYVQGRWVPSGQVQPPKKNTQKPEDTGLKEYSSLLDSRELFSISYQPTNPAWVLCQMIFHFYQTQGDLVEDAIKSYTENDQDLTQTCDEMIKQAEDYFEEEKDTPRALARKIYPKVNLVVSVIEKAALKQAGKETKTGYSLNRMRDVEKELMDITFQAMKTTLKFKDPKQPAAAKKAPQKNAKKAKTSK